MITIFSCLRSFKDRFGVSQENAIKSWLRLLPRPEIILFGETQEAQKACKELDLLYMPEVERNEFGTPRISSIFEKAQEIAHYDLMAYVNSDIILLSDFMDMARRVVSWGRKCVVVGGRYDVRINGPWDFSSPGWETRIRDLWAREGKLMTCGADYFVFNRGLIKEIPPFVVGRAGWDNWLLWRVRNLGVPLVNATRAVAPLHQEHEKPGSKSLETDYNKKIVKSVWQQSFTILDANYELSEGGFRKCSGKFYLHRLSAIKAIVQIGIRGFLRSLLLKISSFQPIKTK